MLSIRKLIIFFCLYQIANASCYAYESKYIPYPNGNCPHGLSGNGNGNEPCKYKVHKSNHDKICEYYPEDLTCDSGSMGCVERAKGSCRCQEWYSERVQYLDAAECNRTIVEIDGICGCRCTPGRVGGRGQCKKYSFCKKQEGNATYLSILVLFIALLLTF